MWVRVFLRVGLWRQKKKKKEWEMKINGWGRLLLLERNEKRKEGRQQWRRKETLWFFLFFFPRFIIEFELLLSTKVQLCVFFPLSLFPSCSILLFAFFGFLTVIDCCSHFHTTYSLLCECVRENVGVGILLDCVVEGFSTFESENCEKSKERGIAG